jgi:hypothetical protein
MLCFFALSRILGAEEIDASFTGVIEACRSGVWNICGRMAGLLRGWRLGAVATAAAAGAGSGAGATGRVRLFRKSTGAKMA